MNPQKGNLQVRRRIDHRPEQPLLFVSQPVVLPLERDDRESSRQPDHPRDPICVKASTIDQKSAIDLTVTREGPNLAVSLAEGDDLHPTHQLRTPFLGLPRY